MRSMSRPILLSALATSLLTLSLPAQSAEKSRLLLITGANNHDWKWTAPELKRILEHCGRFEVDLTEDPKSALANADDLERYAAFVLDYNGPRWGEAAEKNFIDAVRGGTGVSIVHASNNAFPGWIEYEKLVGLMWRKGTGHGRFHEFDVTVTDRDHPITVGMSDLVQHPDELYHKLKHMHDVELRVLATAFSSVESGGTGQQEPMIIVSSYGKARVFHTPLGHVWRNATHAALEDPQLRWLIARGTEWAATGVVTLPPSHPNYLTHEERQQGFRSLFDGQTTEGWRGFKKGGFPDAGWVVENGCLKHEGKGGGGDIITDQQYEEFELRFEWAVAPGANSGVIYLCTEDQNTTWRTGPEYQVFDDIDKTTPVHAAAALYGLVAPTDKVLRPTGHFNTARIVVQGGRVQHWLNGVQVLDAPIRGDTWDQMVAGSKFKSMPEFGTRRRGHIALQDHGDTVWYRSLRIREL